MFILEMVNLSGRKWLIGLMLATTLPYLWLFTTVNWQEWETRPLLVKSQLLTTSANVLGLVGASLLFWQVALGVRFVVRWFTDDVLWVNSLHKILGIYGTLLIFFHPIMEVLAYGESWLYLMVPDFGDEFEFHVTLGRIAAFLLLVVWISSAVLRKKMAYRPWRYIHSLSYVLILLVLLHAREIGSFITIYPLLGGLWNMMLISFVGLMLYRMAKAVGWKKYSYELVDKEKKAGGVFEYVFKPVGGHSVQPKVGQYVYIQLRPWGESHPFTVMSSGGDGVLRFGIRAVGKFTEVLSELKIGARVRIDGPYGVFTIEGQNQELKVLIAGGVGITPFVELVRRYGNEKTYLWFCNRKADEALYRREFKKQLKDRYFDVITGEKSKGKNVFEGRLSGKMLREGLGAHLQAARFFVCGSPGFNQGIRRLLQVDLGIDKERIYIEDFGM